MTLRETVQRFVAGFFLLTAALVSCGGDGRDLPDPGPSSGIDPSSPYGMLSAEDTEKLCDWIAGRFGGYGRGIRCRDGFHAAAAFSRFTCLQSTVSCSATIGEVEECINGVVDADPCLQAPAKCVELLQRCGEPDNVVVVE